MKVMKITRGNFLRSLVGLMAAPEIAEAIDRSARPGVMAGYKVYEGYDGMKLYMKPCPELDTPKYFAGTDPYATERFSFPIFSVVMLDFSNDDKIVAKYESRNREA